MKSKKITIVLSSKGGVGKSMYTYMHATYMHINDRRDVLYVDVDNATTTSSRQLKFMEERVENFSMLDEDNILVRDRIVSYFVSISKLDMFNEIVLDLGSPESSQIPFFLQEFDFVEFFNELNLEVTFVVIIAGGTSYQPTMRHLKSIVDIVKNAYPVVATMNISTFKKYSELRNEVITNCKNFNIQWAEFGDFNPQFDTHSEILENIRKGLGIENYEIGARITLKKELKQVFKNEE